MLYSDEEIKRFAAMIARDRCGGCSKSYNEIKLSIERQLRKVNENNLSDRSA